MNLNELAIEDYCSALRKALRGLSVAECDEIVAEIRVHLQESTLQPYPDIQTAMARLGTPEALAAQYKEEFSLQRTPRRLAPLDFGRALIQSAKTGALGIVYAVIAFLGYSTGLAMFLSGMLKSILPNQTGLWIRPGIFHFGIHNVDGSDGGVGLLLSTRGPAHEVLGWWYIPVTLVISALIIWGTTLSLRKLRKRAKDRWQSLSLRPSVSSFV